MSTIYGKKFKSIWFVANKYLSDTNLPVSEEVQVASRLSKEHFNGLV